MARDSETHSIQLAIKVHPRKGTLQMADTKENILGGHKAKLSGHEQDERKNLIQYMHINSFVEALHLSEPNQCLEGCAVGWELCCFTVYFHASTFS